VGIALENMFHAKAAKGRRVGGMGVCLRILRGFAAKVFHKRREWKKGKRASAFLSANACQYSRAIGADFSLPALPENVFLSFFPFYLL
jgi:hypothetical protein